MDLILLIVVLALIGFFVRLVVTRIPMPSSWAIAIELLAFLAVLLFLLRQFHVPNLLH